MYNPKIHVFSLIFKQLVLEAEQEFRNGNGTAMKLNVSSFTLYTRFSVFLSTKQHKMWNSGGMSLGSVFEFSKTDPNPLRHWYVNISWPDFLRLSGSLWSPRWPNLKWIGCEIQIPGFGSSRGRGLEQVLWFYPSYVVNKRSPWGPKTSKGPPSHIWV